MAQAEVEFIEAKEAFNESVKGWVFFPFQSEALPFNLVDGTSYHVVKTEPGEIRGQPSPSRGGGVAPHLRRALRVSLADL